MEKIRHNITLTVSGVRCSGKTQILQIVHRALTDMGIQCRVEVEGSARIIKNANEIPPRYVLDPNFNVVSLKEESFE